MILCKNNVYKFLKQDLKGGSLFKLGLFFKLLEIFEKEICKVMLYFSFENLKHKLYQKNVSNW